MRHTCRRNTVHEYYTSSHKARLDRECCHFGVLSVVFIDVKEQLQKHVTRPWVVHHFNTLRVCKDSLCALYVSAWRGLSIPFVWIVAHSLGGLRTRCYCILITRGRVEHGSVGVVCLRLRGILLVVHWSVGRNEASCLLESLHFVGVRNYGRFDLDWHTQFGHDALALRWPMSVDTLDRYVRRSKTHMTSSILLHDSDDDMQLIALRDVAGFK